MDILIYSIRAISYTITNPMFLLVLFLMGVILHGKNKKSRLIEKMILGSQSYSALELTISQIVIGIIGGVCASILCTYLGIAFNDGTAIVVMFIISMILMSINPRFLCFSYSGAMLGVISIINTILYQYLDFEKIRLFDINIVSLIALVGVLHIVEGLMVLVDGHKGSLPVFTKRGEETIGGFALNRYYTLPMALLVFIVNGEVFMSQNIDVGNWWPVLKGTFQNFNLGKLVISIIPVLAVVGYNSVTFTKSKRTKSFVSGLYNIIFGGMMILLSQIAINSLLIQGIVIILMPILHEAMLKLERNVELKGKPKYFNESEGIRVLAVGKNSIAQEIGIKSGDIVLAIDGEQVIDEVNFSDILKKCGDKINFKLKRESGKLEIVTSGRISLNDRFGTIFVPKREYGEGVKSKFKDVMNKVMKERKDRENK